MDTSSNRQSLGQSSSIAAYADAPPVSLVGELGGYSSIKRLLDFAASGLLLVLLSPLMAVIALTVRLSSPGPVIYRQRRVGRHNEEFVLYKFRTMVIEAPTLTTEEMKRSTRSYYTKPGALLRRLSLDELPQLFNVLIGEMSLIGPRPSLSSQLRLNTNRQLARIQDLRPGITGWAQVSGRDELTDEAKVAFDAQYRAKCSLSMDCRIALMTIKAVFTGSGAN